MGDMGVFKSSGLMRSSSTCSLHFISELWESDIITSVCGSSECSIEWMADGNFEYLIADEDFVTCFCFENKNDEDVNKTLKWVFYK